MLHINEFFNILLISITYLMIYNFSLVLLFWLLYQYVSINFITIYSFTDLKMNTFFLLIITIILFSIAGIPPFIGFFTKLFILVILTNSNFFFLYIFFFVLLFFGLYFYLQNIRFLYSTATTTINYNHFPVLRLNLYFVYTALFFLFFFIFGFVFLDDILLYIIWLFS